MLETMAKIEIIGPKKYFYPVVGLLHQLGTVHLEDMSKKENLSVRKMNFDEKAEETKNELENLIVRLNGILDTIRPEGEDSDTLHIESDYYKKVWHLETPQLTAEAEHLVEELEDKARELANRKSDLELEFTTVQRYVDIISKIQPLAKQIVTLEGFETVAFLLERKYKDTLDAIKEEMSHLTDDKYELVSADVDENTTAALVIFHKQYSGPVHAFLSDNVNEVRLPAELKNRPFDEVVSEMSSKKEDIPAQIDEIKQELAKLSETWYHKIKAMASAVSDRLDELMCVPQFGETNYTFVVQGWLPYKSLDDTKKQMMKKFGEKVIVTQLELSHHDLEQAPVLIKNPNWAKPFEMVMKIVQPPKYGTIDPTPMVAIFFPLLFGFIIGDMGYALVIGLVATWMKKKFKSNEIAQAICSIFQIGAIAGFMFGILFGEFFGNMPLIYGWLKPMVLPFKIPGFTIEKGTEFAKELEHLGYPAHQYFGKTIFPLGRELPYLMPFLFISVGIGLLHLSVGLILGMVNAFREKARKHAIEKLGLLLVIVAGYAAVLGMVLSGSVNTIMLLVVLVGVFLVGYSSGPINAMEHVFGTMANLFSYMRLIALAISAVVLAAVANKLAASFAEMGPVGLIIGIIIAALLHTINIAVAAFSPTIHSIRLNLLEFFNRFYEAGGTSYQPFKVRR